MTTTMRDAALELAAAGCAVFPLWGVTDDGRCRCGKTDCKSTGKHPLTRHGVKDATREPARVHELWSGREEWANIGVATGRASGFIVLDFDPEDVGPDARLLDLLEAALVELGWLGGIPETRTAFTRRGVHLYFSYESAGTLVRNVTRLGGTRFDLRGDGGYVVVPPSRYAGGEYTWRDGGTRVADLSGPLRVALEDRWGRARETAGRDRLDVERIFRGLREGERDSAIYAYACSRFALGLAYPEVLALVLTAAASCVPAFPEDEARRKVQLAEDFITADRDAALKVIGTEWLRWKSEATGRGEVDEREALLPQSDTGNAERVARVAGDDLLHVPGWVFPWGVFDADTGLWRIDARGQLLVQEEARSALQRYVLGEELPALEAADADAKIRASYGKWAVQSTNFGSVRNCLATLAGRASLHVRPEDLDRDPYLLAHGDGTVTDLRTGERRGALREERHTRCTATAPEESWRGGRWEQFLLEVQPAQEVRECLRRVVGASATGLAVPHVLPICVGDGANGKSTFMEAVVHALGGYAGPAADDLLNASAGGRHPAEVADLYHKRLVVVAETGGRMTLDAAKAKRLTGGDRIKARRMNENFWEFEPTHHLWLMTNDLPRVTDASGGMWRRLSAVTVWEQVFADDGGRTKRELERPEVQGELVRWIVEGAVEFLALGHLAVPEVMRAWAEEYKEEQSDVVQFVEQCLVPWGGEEGTTTEELYAWYRRWAQSVGIRELPQRVFGRDLSRAGVVKYGGRQDIGGRKVQLWRAAIGEQTRARWPEVGWGL